MSHSSIFFMRTGDSIIEPKIIAPFAVLLDAGDSEWRDINWLEKQILVLIGKGCKYFVCFGQASENLHDSIDDVIINHDVLDVATTFHSDESKRETFDFFKKIAMNEMAHGLIIVRNQEDWMSLL